VPNIKIEQLSKYVTSIVANYTGDVQDAIEKKVDKVAKQVLKETKALAPERYGRYKKGFTILKEDSYGITRRTIWNKKLPGLVHLLEVGHKKRGGGSVDPIPHMVPAYNKYAKNIDEEIKKIIRDGG
jgi:hypothetical protein